MQCPSCNSQVNDDEVICPNCGVKLPNPYDVRLDDLCNNPTLLRQKEMIALILFLIFIFLEIIFGK